MILNKTNLRKKKSIYFFYIVNINNNTSGQIIEKIMSLDQLSILVVVEFESHKKFIHEFTMINNHPLYICTNTALKHMYLFNKCCFYKN